MKNRHTLIIIGLSVVAYYFLRRAENSRPVEFMVMALVLFGAALIVSTLDYPKITAEERKYRFYELFDIHRPEEPNGKSFSLCCGLFICSLRFSSSCVFCQGIHYSTSAATSGCSTPFRFFSRSPT
jgi:hypothetical protein